MKEPIEGEVITIKKGDTLWHLARKYLDNPTKWPEFRKYNTFTNPHRIYPGEKMQLPIKAAKEIVKEATKEIEVRSSEIEDAIKALQNSNQEISRALRAQMEELEALKKAVNLLSEEIARLENKIKSVDDRLSQAETAVKDEFQRSNKQVNQLGEKVDTIDGNVKAIGGKVDQLAMDGQKITQSVETLTIKVSELEKMKMAEPEIEKPSHGKKAFAVLTVLAGSIAWFVVSALSNSD
jgi:chromosome segregation ATPase